MHHPTDRIAHTTAFVNKLTHVCVPPPPPHFLAPSYATVMYQIMFIHLYLNQIPGHSRKCVLKIPGPLHKEYEWIRIEIEKNKCMLILYVKRKGENNRQKEINLKTHTHIMKQILLISDTNIFVLASDIIYRFQLCMGVFGRVFLCYCLFF